VNATTGRATDEVIDEQGKITGQQMSLTHFVHKHWYVFCSKE
jgi:hypothetical protein